MYTETEFLSGVSSNTCSALWQRVKESCFAADILRGFLLEMYILVLFNTYIQFQKTFFLFVQSLDSHYDDNKWLMN